MNVYETAIHWNKLQTFTGYLNMKSKEQTLMRRLRHILLSRYQK